MRGAVVPAMLRVHTSWERPTRSSVREIGDAPQLEATLEWLQLRPQLGYAPHGLDHARHNRLDPTRDRGYPQRDIAEGQAWFYPRNRTILLWELVLDRDAKPDPREDLLYRTLWAKLERFLCARYPAARQIVTPAWEPDYDHTLYQSFLRGLGYQPATARTWAKRVPQPLDPHSLDPHPAPDPRR